MPHIRIESDHPPLYPPPERQKQPDKAEPEPTHTDMPPAVPQTRQPDTPPALALHTVAGTDSAIPTRYEPHAPVTRDGAGTGVHSDVIERRDQVAKPLQTRVPADQILESDEPYIDEDGDVCEVCKVTEARIDLRESHGLLTAAILIEALGEHFTHTRLQDDDDDGWLYDEYANEIFVITYCLNCKGRDQVRVRWLDPDAEDAHTEDELPALARQLARMLGGGTNLCLVDKMVRCKRLRVPPVKSELLLVNNSG